MRTLAERRERLAAAQLYLVTDAGMSEEALEEALLGGVDMVQLRDPALADDALLERAVTWRGLCDRHHALLWINDRPDLARRAGADGVHVGQDDAPVEQARSSAGGDLLVGLSTHSLEQFETGVAAGADELSVGPVWETPTKPGRPATGLELVRAVAATQPSPPWFAIGGIDGSNAEQVVAAGAQRIVVVRAIREAANPRAAAEWPATPQETMARGYARGRERDEAARAALKPLEPGERPTAVTIGAIIATIAAVANVVALVLGYDADKSGYTVRTAVTTAILVVMAVGMWRARYWGVLGFQTLLAFTIILGSLALMTAANWAAVLLALALIVGSGTLFWFLVKAMARIQMPERPDR